MLKRLLSGQLYFPHSLSASTTPGCFWVTDQGTAQVMGIGHFSFHSV